MTRTVIFTAVALALLSSGRIYSQSSSIVLGVERSDTLHWYTGAPIILPLIVGPGGTEIGVSNGATITTVDSAGGRYQATLADAAQGAYQVCVTARLNDAMAMECIPIVVEQPEMTGGIDRWRALRATVGRKYNPSSEWRSLHIPAADYQTVVEIDGAEVFNREGNRFRDGDLPDELMVTPQMKEIRTTVYWKPEGTPDRRRWVALATTDDKTSAAVVPGRRKFEISYLVPEQVEGFEFAWELTPERKTAEFGPIILQQNIGGGNTVGIQASAVCAECERFAIRPKLLQADDRKWILLMQLEKNEPPVPAINGRRFDVGLQLNGRGGATGFGVASVTVHYDPAQWAFAGRTSGDSASPDVRPDEMIRSLKPFAGKELAIFSIEGELRGSIIRSMQAEDRKDIEQVEAICRQLYDEPLGDCLNTLLKLTSSARTNYGRNYQALKLGIAQEYGIDPDELNDPAVQKMIAIIQTVKARREARPNIFYLVTSTEKRPRIIGIVMANGGSFFDGFTIREAITGSALQRELAKLGPTFTQDLPRMLPSAMLHEEADLQMIWPEEQRAGQ